MRSLNIIGGDRAATALADMRAADVSMLAAASKDSVRVQGIQIACKERHALRRGGKQTLIQRIFRLGRRANDTCPRRGD